MTDNKYMKILVCGDVEGKLKTLYTRINKIVKAAGDFDALFCVGDFFGSDFTVVQEYLSCGPSIPIPTFIVSHVNDKVVNFLDNPNGCQLCTNLTYLGPRGVYSFVSGLRIIYIVSETESEQVSDSSTSLEDLKLLPNARALEDAGILGVDILLTTKWPKNIQNRDETFTMRDVPKQAFSSMSKLAFLTKPRYHFSASENVYYERCPYRNHKVLQEKNAHVTRFIGLAKVKNPDNQKYIYAVKLVPIETMDRTELMAQPPDTTENPYLDMNFNQTAKETEVQTEQFFYNLSGGTKRGGFNGKKNFNDKRRRDSTGDNNIAKNIPSKRKRETVEEKLAKPRVHAACWFCLGNPLVEKRLVVSVGNQAYLALPRGPLTRQHLLVLTVGHHQSWTACPPYVRAEVDQYKSALTRFFNDQSMAIVAFERNLKTQHFQLQVVPVPYSVAGEVKQAFLDASLKDNSPCQLKPLPKNADLNEICRPGVPYFYVELPTGERLFGQIPRDRHSTSDLQFGRAVLASPRILNCPEKHDWHNCIDDKETETELALEMRNLFTPYEFNE